MENRKLWKKWEEKDAQGQQKRGICEDFRELIYRWATMCEKPKLVLGRKERKNKKCRPGKSRK